jgi:hypothetical protein
MKSERREAKIKAKRAKQPKHNYVRWRMVQQKQETIAQKLEEKQKPKGA